jgi:hypothetical protein
LFATIPARGDLKKREALDLPEGHMIILALGIAGLIIGIVLVKRWQTAERETSVAEQTPS